HLRRSGVGVADAARADTLGVAADREGGLRRPERDRLPHLLRGGHYDAGRRDPHPPARTPSPGATRMSESMTIQCPFHFNRQARGRKQLQPGEAPVSACAWGRVPRVAKLLALAHRFEALPREGVVQSYAELAQLGQVTPARISQVMALLGLAPDIQEAA